MKKGKNLERDGKLMDGKTSKDLMEWFKRVKLIGKKESGWVES